MDSSLVIAIIAAIASFLSGTGWFFTYKAQNRKVAAEARKAAAEAEKTLSDTLMARINQQDAKIEQQDAKMVELRDRVVELEEERDALYEGIRILVQQLESNRICPEWQPIRRPKAR